MKTKKAKKTKAGNLWKRNGIYYLVRMLKGKRTIVSLHTGDEDIAIKRRDEALLPALLANTAEKVTRHIAETRDLLSDVKYPLEIVWKQYLKSSSRPQSSAGTLGNYERFYNQFHGWLKMNYPEIEKINQVTTKEAELYAAHLWKKEDKKDTGKKAKEKKELTAEEKKLKRGITANTFNYHIQGLNLVFKVVCNTEKTPFSGIQRKNGGQMNRKDFTADQMKSIFEAIDKPECEISNKPEMKLLCFIGAFTGLRLVDAIHLEYSQIDFAGRMITATPRKTMAIQRKVHIPLHPELKSQLDRAESLAAGGYVMPAMVERYQRNPDGIMKDFSAVLDTAKLTETIKAERGRDRRVYGFHSFRHSFASFAANAGVPISTLAAILGDNTRTLEKYYVKISDESKNKAIMSMPALTTGSDTGALIDIKPVSELDEMKNRVKQAVEYIGTAKITAAIKAELLKILKPV